MGQEASVPIDGRGDGIDLSLEEQAKAPPSATSAGVIHSNTTNQSSSQSTLSPLPLKDGSKRKLMTSLPNMFRGATKEQAQQQHHQHHHHQNNNYHHDTESFEQREAARAAAAGGNLYHQSSGDLRENDDDDGYVLQKLPAQPSTTTATADSFATSTVQSSGSFLFGGHDASIPSSSSSTQPHSSHETTTPHHHSDKKSIFSGRASARGVINSMRNLTIGSALRKQKEVNDWEKQWDEDEDDSDDGGDAPSTPLRPGLGADHPNRTNSNSGSSSIILDVPPPPPPPKMASEQLGYAAATAVNGAPRSPVRLVAAQTYQPTTASAVHLVSPLLSTSPDRQTGLDPWDATSVPTVPVQEQLDIRKPDVDMFLPVLRVLGKGSFGKVVLVQKREGKERGQLFAMKILKKTHLVKRRQIERTRTERKVLSAVNHPFIMKLHYAFQTPDKLYLILDYCPGGELFFHLSRFRRFPERVARFYAAELLLAIGHLHMRGIIYRDLKPENVLLDADGHVKLGDFGLAKAGIEHPYEGATSMCGTPEYMAPEVLAQQGHGFCVDYWGLGMIVYEMMTGLPPWYTTDRAQLFRRLKSAPLDIPQYFSESSADCVTALLERNPRRRLGVTGIRTAMEHAFFRNISWRALYSRRVEAPVRPCEGWRPPGAVSDTDPLASNGEADSSQFYSDGVAKLDSSTLDTATQNFDAQFTRMPVESEDHGAQEAIGEELLDDLDENTFLGFSFDIIHEKNKAAISNGGDLQHANSSSRLRTQHFHSGLDQQEKL